MDRVEQEPFLTPEFLIQYESNIYHSTLLSPRKQNIKMFFYIHISRYKSISSLDITNIPNPNPKMSITKERNKKKIMMKHNQAKQEIEIELCFSLIFNFNSNLNPNGNKTALSTVIWTRTNRHQFKNPLCHNMIVFSYCATGVRKSERKDERGEITQWQTNMFHIMEGRKCQAG